MSNNNGDLRTLKRRGLRGFEAWFAFLACFAILASLLGTSSLLAQVPRAKQEVESDDSLLPFCRQLGNRASPEEWQVVQEKLTEFQNAIEARLEKLPYEKPAEMAKPTILTSLSDGASGTHSRWLEHRYVSSYPPPQDSYISQAAVILNGNLTRIVTTTPRIVVPFRQSLSSLNASTHTSPEHVGTH